jgi:hypothetical protein
MKNIDPRRVAAPALSLALALNLLAVPAMAQTTAAPAPAAAAAAAAPLSIDAGVAVAERWLALADANDAAAMWAQSSPVMKARIDAAAWGKHVAAVHTSYGNVAGPRFWTRMEQELNAPNLPPGRFMAVQFLAPFSKAPRVMEVVSLAWDGARWLPVGYQYRADVPAAAAAAPAPATAR